MDTVKSLEKALIILEAFLQSKKGLTISEICTLTKLPKTSVLRHVNTLEGFGYLIKTNNNTYFVGIKFLEFSNIVSSYLSCKDILSIEMKKLNDITNETINFYVINDLNRICIEQVISNDTVLKKFSMIGDTMPLYCGASGKVLLAFSDDEYLDNYFKCVKFDKFTSSTITDIENLKLELSKIKKQGYAISYGEREEDIFSIAIPIFSNTNSILGCIAISGPLARNIYFEDKYKRLLLDLSKKLSYKFDAIY